MAITEKTTSLSTQTFPKTRYDPAPTRARVRVWLTDDNQGIRNGLADLLTRSGEFDCDRQFHSAEALLEGLGSDGSPDVILLDIEMGGMSGVDALRPIRALAPHVRVLIVTSFFDPIYETRAMRDGASAFLLKAYAPQELVAAIHQALASPIHLTEIALPASQEAGCRTAGSNLAVGKRLLARFTLWLATGFSALTGQVEYHQPATTPK